MLKNSETMNMHNGEFRADCEVCVCLLVLAPTGALACALSIYERQREGGRREGERACCGRIIHVNTVYAE